MIEDVRIDQDEAGFFLVLAGDLEEEARRYLETPDADELGVRLPQDAAIRLLAVTRDEIGPWVAEMEFHRDAYARASDGERAAVLGLDHDDGLDPADPKSAGYADRMLAGADLARDRERERR